MIVCNLCKAVVSDETTVGNLIKEADTLRREGMRNEAKLIQAMEKYYTACKALSKSRESHEECVKCVNKHYEDVYRLIQGSRA